MNNYNITYSKAKHLCVGTRDCENRKAKIHECPYEMPTVIHTADDYPDLCTCCHECEKECLEMSEDE